MFNADKTEDSFHFLALGGIFRGLPTFFTLKTKTCSKAGYGFGQ